ncbi:MAG: hypothetical protein DDT22_00773 [candidate division WS2 bacterium]|nr:hypothetical protein [Candidatus Lithacetigena glycinireducens]
MKRLYFLVFIFVLVVIFASKVYAVRIDCKKGSELLINNTTIAVREYTLDRTTFTLPPHGSVVIGCSGVLNITVQRGVVYKVFDLHKYFFDWSKSMSFIAGLLTATAFVVAANRRL